MSVKERLIEYLKYKKISARKFELACNLSVGYIRAIRKSIQPDKISTIATNYPDLNTGWLLTGEGEMLKKISKMDGLSIAEIKLADYILSR